MTCMRYGMGRRMELAEVWYETVNLQHVNISMTIILHRHTNVYRIPSLHTEIIRRIFFELLSKLACQSEVTLL